MRISPRSTRTTAIVAVFLLLWAARGFCQSGPPPIPPDPFLDSYSFEDTNWLSDLNYPPIAFTNLVSVEVWNWPALQLDTGNASPAYLQYRVVETNGYANLNFSAGVIYCIFICDWASADTNQGGSGPGSTSYLVGAGDWSSGSPKGLWRIYISPEGTNISFGGVSNGVSTNYVSAPISWPAGSIHLLGLSYSSNTVMYLDGQEVATGGPVAIVPSTNVSSNAWFVGSDSWGYEQAQAIFWYLEFDNTNALWEFGPGSFTNGWNWMTNSYYAWLAAQGGFHFDGSSGFRLPPTPTNTFNTNYAAYTNWWMLIQFANSPKQALVTLINPGLGLTYLIETNAHLEPVASTNWQPWVTLVGSNTVTPAPLLTLGSNALYFSAFLVWESTGTNLLPDWWQMEYFGHLNVNPYADPDGDGLCNLDEYLLGLNPTNAHTRSALHTDAQALVLAYTNDSACVYHLSITNGPNTNTLLVTMWPTAVGTNYQIYSQAGSGAPWIVETNFLGTNTSTTVAISLNGRTLSLIGGYGEDSDGDGLPDGYEVLATHTDPYLADTGMTGIPDGYKDPDGDGYSNLEEYHNGTNPLVFDTPAAPPGFFVDPTGGGNSFLVGWQPASGPVQGYVLTIADLHNNTLATVDLPASQLIYAYTNSAAYRFYLKAEYAGGLSSANYIVAPSTNEPSYVAPNAVVNGPGGHRYLLASPILPGVVGYNVTEYSYSEPYPINDSKYMQPGGYYPGGTNKSFFVSTSRFTNGMAQLTDAEVPPYSQCEFLVQAVKSNGKSGNFYVSVAAPDGDWCMAMPFVDGRTQMVQNVTYLLRVASATAPFSDDLTVWPRSSQTGYATNYVYSDFFYMYAEAPGANSTPYLSGWNNFAPFEDNYFYRNLVFDSSQIDGSGNLDTGFTVDSGGGYQALTYTLSYLPLAFTFPTYNYVTNSNQAPVPAVLSQANTDWLGYNNDWGDFGVSFANSLYSMANTPNLYGLPVTSLKICLGSGNFTTLSTGGSTPNMGNFFTSAAQPVLHTVDYYFARTGFVPSGSAYLPDPMPDAPDGSFSVTNTTAPVILDTVGQSLILAGYAKEAVSNGYSGVFAYVGQYFTNALLMSNGAVTTNQAGIVSEYGEFFPTLPGHVALMTKPDPFQNNLQGRCEIDVIRLSLDVNHDGIMDESFTGPDNGGYTFWANNDYDRWHTTLLDGTVEDDLQSAAQTDCNYTNAGNRAIPCPRDLEDYARLWVSGVSNTLPRLPTGSTVTVNWEDHFDDNGNPTQAGNPTIDLFQAADADGGIGYLTNLTTASNQINTNLCRYVGRLGPGGSIQLNDCSYSNCWAGDHYIFCGVAYGSGNLVLNIMDASSNVLAQSLQSIQIVDIKQMYERWTVGENDDNQPLATVAPMTTPELVTDGQPKFRYPYDPAYDTNDTYILFVHGYNVATWEKDCFAETAYKRLYWQGYQGRFGEFRWPTYNSALLFTLSERQAWLSGAGLLNLLDTLNSYYPGKVYLLAHSLGNVVAGQALRLTGANHVVNTYVASQAALSARAYDNTIPTDATNYYTPISPDSIGRYYTNTSPPYFNGIGGASAFVNFINTNDWALMGDSLFTGHPGWLEIQQGKLLLTTQPMSPSNPQEYWYTTPSSNHPSGYYFQNEPIGPYRNLLFTNDTFEIFSEAAQSYSKALGAEPTIPVGFARSVNLFGAPYNFGATHYGHSLEFRSDNMTTAVYWHELLSFGFNIQP